MNKTTATAAALAFTTADRDALAILASRLTTERGRAVEVETCADDGAEWSAVLAATKDGADMLPAVTVQTTQEPGSRLVILAADGRRVLARGDDLAAMVAALKLPRLAH